MEASVARTEDSGHSVDRVSFARPSAGMLPPLPSGLTLPPLPQYAVFLHERVKSPITSRWDLAMTSIHSLPATDAALRRAWRTKSAATGRAYSIPNLLAGCRKAYMVHMINVRRLSDCFLSCMTVAFVHVQP
jgi:hypothetical protein